MKRTSCPCGSLLEYRRCCGPLIEQLRPAMTAEELMRSRYSAFAVGDDDYLSYSWHPLTRPSTIDSGADLEWTGVTVLSTDAGGPFDTVGTVEFIARARGLPDGVMRERSNFARHPESNRWVYLDGVALDPHGA